MVKITILILIIVSMCGEVTVSRYYMYLSSYKFTSVGGALVDAVGWPLVSVEQSTQFRSNRKN